MDTVSYWRKICIHPEAERKARELLNCMCCSDDDDNDTGRPYCYASQDIISYNNMLHLYANRGDVENARALLLLMEESGSNSFESQLSRALFQQQQQQQQQQYYHHQ